MHEGIPSSRLQLDDIAAYAHPAKKFPINPNWSR
jgi:hypothetical protein